MDSNYAQFMHAITSCALLMIRMMVAFSMLPLFSAASVPVSVRIAFTAGLALCLLPMVLGHTALLDIEVDELLLSTIKEACIGAVLGLLGSLVFYALQAAGSIIEMQSGLSMASMIDPNSGHESTLVSSLFQQLFSILFIVTGGLLAFIGMLFESYRAWPLETLAPSVNAARIAALLISSVSEMLWLAIKIAAPFAILLLLVDLAMGFLSRMVPQANAFFLSLPIKVLLLSALLLAFCTVLSGNPRSVFEPEKHFRELLIKIEAVSLGSTDRGR